MPKKHNKRGAKRGNFQAAFHGGRGVGNGNGSFAPFEGTSMPQKGRHAFTLQEEARNTDRHGASFWNTDQRLRDNQVSFVSAGKFEPTKMDANEAKSEEDEPAEAEEEDDDDDDQGGEADVEDEPVEVIVEDEQAAGSSIKSPAEVEKLIFIVDTQGSGPVRTGMAPPTVRPASPTPSDSSEEVILFRGRDQQGRALSKARLPSRPAQTTTTAGPIDAKIRVFEDRIESLNEELHSVGLPNPPVPQKLVEDSSVDFEALLPPKSSKVKPRRNKYAVEKLEEDNIIADYIANMDPDDFPSRAFNRRDLGGTDEESRQETEASSGEVIGEASKTSFQGGWNRSDIEDLDDMSTSDGVMGEVQAILSKRERVSGTQYLVVWDHQTTDEARWVPSTTLTSVVAVMHVEKFEAEEKLVRQFEGNEDDESSDSDDMGFDVEDDENDQDLLQKKIDQMSDEKIARLLSKQEELGMGSDEILLLDAYEEEEAEVNNNTSFAKSAYHSAIAARQSKALRGPSLARGEFPSATLLADAYDGFDVMDFDRPSLQRKPKSRKGKLVVEISDSDPESTIQMAYANDRMKKKVRRQEREELRAQGLLGAKNEKADMKQKYQEGMSITDVKEEIKAFLLGDDTTLSLAPMGKADRKLIHELANTFNLKSKSAGNGTQRFPVLYKTNRTLAFHNGTFDALYSRLTRRFLPRMNVGGKRASGGAGGRRGGGGFSSAAVRYRDGDVVGGSAPELGVENRGRAMLEKMGWTKGTALGSENNKGILQPVSHVVKTGKAGLG